VGVEKRGNRLERILFPLLTPLETLIATVRGKILKEREIGGVDAAY